MDVHWRLDILLKNKGTGDFKVKVRRIMVFYEQHTGSKIGKSLRALADRLKNSIHNENSLEHHTVSNTCNNCKFCVGQEGYDYQRGMIYCVHSWCKKGIQDSYDKYKPDYDVRKDHYICPCNDFEEGSGEYILMDSKEKRELGF